MAPGIPHHVTQRGTDRQTVFFTWADRRVYMELLRVHSQQTGVAILAYCLMRNHIHLVAVPSEVDSLAVCLRRTHGRYAQYLNARRQRSGHLWQNRFYSCPLDRAHLAMAVRYVEQNPVRARIGAGCAEYRWSSAAAHLSGHDPNRILDMQFWRDAGGRSAWVDLLGNEAVEVETRRLRKATYAGQPLGSQEFTEQWKRRTISEQRSSAQEGAT